MKDQQIPHLKLLLLLIVLLLVAILPDIFHTLFKKAPPPPPPTLEPVRLTYVPQFVLISFDGSRAIPMWQMIRGFKDELKTEGIKMNDTHFINAAYFLTKDNRSIYQPPHQAPGFTNIGVSEDIDHIRQRVSEVNLAISDGDEIAVHTVGHLSGLHWDAEDWKSELSQFDSILFGLDKLYPNENIPVLNLKPSDIIGFRAPYLDHDHNLFDALHTLEPRYRYDSSEVGDGMSWPTKDKEGLWHIPLGVMARGGRGVLVMDYNWYAQDTGTKDVLKKDSPEWKAVYEKTLAGLRQYFEENYHGSRAPVLVGYHFETWNDGVYWEVLKTFAKEVCAQPEVNCGTFRDLVDYLDAYGTPKLPPAQTNTASIIHAEPHPTLAPEDEHNE